MSSRAKTNPICASTVRRLPPYGELVSGRCRNYAFPRHVHDRRTIGIVRSGREAISLRGETHAAGPGSVYCLRADEAHAAYPVDEDGWTYASLYLDNDYFGAAEHSGASPGAGFASMVINTPALTRIASGLLDLLGSSECDAEIDSAVSALAASISELSGGGDALPLNGKPPADFRQVKAYLRAHFRRPVSIARLASDAGLHVSYFIDAFRRAEGLTPHAYLVSLRVEAAREALRKGTALSSVAIECGFYDQSHLSRHFKRIYGLTPGAFMRVHRLAR